MAKKKFFGKLKDALLGKGLPLLANVITGGAAGTVINLVKGVIGIDSDDPAELEKAVMNNPDVVLKLKELELTHKVELERLALQGAQVELEETKAYIGDVASARAREMQITSATGKRDWLMMALAITVVVGFFTLVFVALADPTKMSDNGPINLLFGAMVSGFTMVLSYFFGSSKGSSDKNTIMEKQSAASKIVATAKESFNNAKG